MDSRTKFLLLVLLSALGLGAGQLAAKDREPQPVEWWEPVTVATGNAMVGPWEMNDSEFHYLDDATPALTDDGDAVLVWVDNQAQDVFLQYYDDQDQPRFGEPVNVSGSPDIFSWLPRIQVADSGHIYVLWQEIVFSGGSHGGEIFFARSTDGGENFSEPLNLSQTTQGAGKGRLTEEQWDNGSLDFVLSPEGDIYVAWTEYEGELYVRRSTDDGESFNAAVQVVADHDRPARAPALAVGTKGTIYLAWTEGEDPQANIQWAYSTDGGDSFDLQGPVHTTDGHDDTPSLARDEVGGAHLVYAHSSIGPNDQAQVFHAHLFHDGQPASEPTQVSQPTTGTESARAPTIDVDGEGQLYLIWEHHPHPGSRAQGLGFAFSADGGKSFTEPELIPGSDDPPSVNGSLQGQMGHKLAVNSAGGLAVANSHFRLAQESRVVMIRGTMTQ
ncbi:sialidase family protein [Marinimicrobium sp. ABcell2]|uniref:sialidase family protein n=1 Tax=Marinimicrobium sp. ABcell2 TaxID=3069751 RepID=UPI0027AECAE9|nr:sialidase family protein [Marinimicrobium sp. ABcell2]MDQ2077002.1 sialidase family protein [Marinimicrobium sp. ABcell2]